MKNSSSKKSYNFSFFTSLWLACAILVILLLVQWIFEGLYQTQLLVFGILSFIVSFLTIQINVEKFISRKFTSLYKNVSLLADFPLEEEFVTTDMENLTRRVGEFAENKKLEIQALKIRENYRREFIGNISHELKTPLFTIEGYIESLLDGAINDEKRRINYLERANKAVERLIFIVEDLDMISKLESGELHLEKENFDIIKVIETVFEMLEMHAEKLKISLTLDKVYRKPVLVKADKERIQQVITNLVMNSIKYGKVKGTTEISVEFLTSKKVIVRITDNGEGFKEKDIPRLFERFYRIDKSGSRQEGGSGLGLSIVKHILEAHKEKIYVESDYGVGSEFSFTLERGEKR